MKFSTMLCAFVLVVTALALTADGAFSATTVKSSKSNSSYKLDPADANADKACTDKGGVVSTDMDGKKICTIPSPENNNLNSSRSNIYRSAPSDANADKACVDKGGVVSADKDGNKICTMAEAPKNCPPPREMIGGHCVSPTFPTPGGPKGEATTLQPGQANTTSGETGSAERYAAMATKFCVEAGGVVWGDAIGNKFCGPPMDTTVPIDTSVSPATVRLKMLSAAREATTKAKNVASAIQQVRRQPNDDEKDTHP